jgi:hypothetical protein
MGIPTGDEVSANDYDLEQYQKLKVNYIDKYLGKD